jgi:hypothetical protein
MKRIQDQKQVAINSVQNFENIKTKKKESENSSKRNKN